MAYQQKTPGVVITAGILLIVYGSLMLVCGICGGASAVGGNAEAEAQFFKDVPGHTVMKYASLGSNILIGFVAVLAGIGVFQLMSVARIAAYFICTFSILFALVRNLYEGIFVLEPTQKMVAQQMKNQPQPPPFDMNQFVTGFFWVFVVIVILFHLVFTIPPMLLLTTRSARDAFAGIGPPDGRDDPDPGPRRYEGYDDDDDHPSKSPPKFPGDTGIKREE